MQTDNLALGVGRLLQKKQTGFVHYCHEGEGLTGHDTIPVFENALFALALFRSRLSDHVLEGKAIIEKLLCFEKEGNFPVYLHEYPTQNDPLLSYRLLPIFYWITVDFSHVVGKLSESLQKCIERILERTEGDSPWVEFRRKAFQGKVGEAPKTLHEWSEALISLQIAQKKGGDIQPLLEEACRLWHPGLSLFVGPSQQRHQWGSSPEVTLFDLFMCQWQHHFPERVKIPHPIHLRGALIRPLQITFEEKASPFVHFSIEEECPLFIAWENHTFVLAKKQLQVEGSAEELLLTPPSDEDMGVNFYFDYHPDHEIYIEGKKATVFRSKETLEILSKGLKMELTFTSEDGEYCGHVMRGNRPSQHLCHGENAFAAYDWRIAIRTVSLGKSPIRVQLRLQTLENRSPLPLHASHYPHIESTQ